MARNILTEHRFTQVGFALSYCLGKPPGAEPDASEGIKNGTDGRDGRNHDTASVHPKLFTIHGRTCYSIGEHRHETDLCYIHQSNKGRRIAEAWAKLAEHADHDGGREGQAEAHCLRALTLDARNPRAYRLLQTIVSRHFARRSLVRAEAITRKILDFRPEDGLEWANLGLFLREQKRYRESHRAYRNAVRFAPDRPQVLNDAGVVLHYHLRRIDEAVKLYTRAVELDPETIDALENLGVICFDRGRYGDAETWFRKVLALDPRRAKALRFLARVKKAGDPR